VDPNRAGNVDLRRMRIISQLDMRYFMISIEYFPKRFTFINNLVERLELIEKDFDPQGNTDFFVRLNDGREYAFTAFSIKNIEMIMNRDELGCFIVPGLIIVKNLDIDSIFEAVEQCLRLSENKEDRMSHFGVLQI
jgi:hypothetical protein